MNISDMLFYVHGVLSFFIAPEHPYYQVVFYGLIIIFGSFVARTLLILIVRVFGLYHINQYFYWPRFPWRIIWNIWMSGHEWWQEVFTFGKRSTAGFTNLLSVLSLVYRSGMIPLGRAYGFGLGLLMPVGLKTKRHLMIVGMTGSGKTVFLALLVSLWRSSVFLIDPKGSVTHLLMRRSRKTWHVIAPYDKNIQSASWNFFDEIKAAEHRDGKDAAVRIVEIISESLIVSEAGERNPFFPNSARAFVSAVILHVRTACLETCHNPVYVYRLMTRGYSEKSNNPKIAFDLLLEDILKNTAYNGLIASRATAIADAGETTRGNVLATLREKIKWLGLPELEPVLTSSTFLFQDLKKRDDSVVSLVAPASEIRGTLSPLSRLLTNILSHTFESIPGGKKIPCLSVIDELPAQGHNERLEEIAPVLRSHGIQLIGAVQDLEGLQRAYPNSWEGFLGNADAVFWMASNHQSTLEYLSRLLGKRSCTQKVKGTSRRAEHERDVMTPEQLRRFLNAAKENVIVTRAGTRPLKLKLLKYYTNLPVSRYEPDPDYKESFLKRLMRKLIDRFRPVKEFLPHDPIEDVEAHLTPETSQKSAQH